MKQLPYVSLFLFFLPASSLHAQGPDYLTECWKKEVNGLHSNFAALHFTEKRSELEKNFEPWQATHFKGNGLIWCNADNFYKKDTVVVGHRSHTSTIQYNKGELLSQTYDAKNITPVTKSMKETYILQTARYTPALLLNYFKENKIAPDKASTAYYALYKTSLHQQPVSLYIRKSDSMAYQVMILSDHELMGDVLTTILYDEPKNMEGFVYPSSISIQKMNGKIKDEVTISNASLTTQVSPLLTKPANYTYPDEVHPKADLSVEKYAEHIHFITLKHTDDKVMVVEFKNFLLVADAPLSTANGEAIIKEAKKIAPNKPIKYFVFGHHHDHFIGGLRAFVHEGSEIICTQQNREYVKAIINAPHTLNPDVLQREPKKAELDTLTSDTKVITDGTFEMKIIQLGAQSQHSSDFLYYYFPAEKLLVENDLLWIRREGAPTKANVREAALYKSIQDKKLDVKTIVQSSPAMSRIAKSIIPFEDLEKANTLK